MQEGKRQKQIGGLIQEELNKIFQRFGLNMINGGMVSILTLNSIKPEPSTNDWGQKYPGGAVRKAIVQYKGESYHIGFGVDFREEMALFDLWKQSPNAEVFEELFESDDSKKRNPFATLNARELRFQILMAMLNAVPVGFKDFEPVALKNNRKGGKELNREVKEISNGGGTRRLDENGNQVIYQDRNGKNPAWKGAEEYEVTVEGRSNEIRILKQEAGTDANGNKLYRYGWTDSHYENTINTFKTKDPVPSPTTQTPPQNSTQP